MSHSSSRPTALSVNVNKVALLRNSRQLGIPSVTRAAELCLMAGAAGITVHPRPDERHIRLADVLAIGELMTHWPDREFNIEGNPFHNLMQVSHAVRARGLPLHQLTFVPDAVGQLTSDHGWRLPADADRLHTAVHRAKLLGVRVSLFMDAEPDQMAAVQAVGADRVELYTEPYAASHALGAPAAELTRFASAAHAAREVGLAVNAGHDLNLDNLGPFLQAVQPVSEVSIGHALMADALEWGYEATVKAYLQCIASVQA